MSITKYKDDIQIKTQFICILCMYFRVNTRTNLNILNTNNT